MQSGENQMNDRYLYRAKRIDNGEWIVGNRIDDGVTGQVFIHAAGNTVNESDKVGEDGCLRFVAFEVDPSTICQCTGLKDKNEKLIWENDVVEMYDRNTDYKWRAVVLFGNPNCEYTWGWQLEPIGKCDANTDILCWIEMEESGAICEVIGSAIDNPELLGVGL